MQGVSVASSNSLAEQLARPLDPDMGSFLADVRRSLRAFGVCLLSAFPDEDRKRHFAVRAVALGYLIVSNDGDKVRLTGLGQAVLDARNRGGPGR